MKDWASKKRTLNVHVLFGNGDFLQEIDDIITSRGVFRIRLHSTKSTSELVERFQSDKVDAVIIDADNDKSSPEKTIRELRTILPPVAIIVVSSSEDASLPMRCFDNGAQDYIPKSLIVASAQSAHFPLMGRAILFAIERIKQQQRIIHGDVRLEHANLILSGISEIARKLLVEEDIQVEDTMRILGERVPATRVFMLFCGCHEEEKSPNRPIGFYYNITKKHTGSEDEIEVKEETPIANDEECDKLRTWVEHGIPIRSHATRLPSVLTPLYTTMGIFKDTDYVFLIPISINGDPWGVVGYPTAKEYEWSIEEITAVTSISRLISFIAYHITKEKYAVEMIERRFSEVNAMFDHSHANVDTNGGVS